jgi:hypothetical protein
MITPSLSDRVEAAYRRRHGPSTPERIPEGVGYVEADYIVPQALAWLRNGRTDDIEQALDWAIARARNMTEQKARRISHETGAER